MILLFYITIFLDIVLLVVFCECACDFNELTAYSDNSDRRIYWSTTASLSTLASSQASWAKKNLDLCIPKKLAYWNQGHFVGREKYIDEKNLDEF